ncbi:hypothetical protein [Streptomyces sp. NPDC088249]|uniref:hypothetical protein n=1 Tax=Streptomyces sp. NPDC088249 TaxID=3365843 RepID=UPI003820EE28
MGAWSPRTWDEGNTRRTPRGRQSASAQLTTRTAQGWLMRGRREHPALLPGIAKARIVGDDQAVHAVLDALRATCTVTEPALYPGGPGLCRRRRHAAAGARAGTRRTVGHDMAPPERGPSSNNSPVGVGSGSRRPASEAERRAATEQRLHEDVTSRAWARGHGREQVCARQAAAAWPSVVDCFDDE